MGIASHTSRFGREGLGDNFSFDQLFNEHYLSLCHFANRYVGDMDMARSLVQEVFVYIWINRDRLEISHSAKSYLYHAVKNKSINFLKEEKCNPKIEDSSFNMPVQPFQDRMEEAELRGLINQSINQLPEKCREIFLLSRSEELKYAEIAQKLNISVKTVEMQIGIALKRIREKLSDYHSFNLFCFLFQK